MLKKRQTKIRPYDTAEYLTTGADMAAYLDAVLDDCDPALGDARARRHCTRQRHGATGVRYGFGALESL